MVCYEGGIDVESMYYVSGVCMKPSADRMNRLAHVVDDDRNSKAVVR